MLYIYVSEILTAIEMKD